MKKFIMIFNYLHQQSDFCTTALKAIVVVAMMVPLFYPLNAIADTDSAVLIDNFDVKVNGTSVNPNFNFEDGTTSGFVIVGDVSVVTNVGSIGSPDGSAYFVQLTTGPGAARSSEPYSFDISLLHQDFSFSGPANVGDEVAVSFCYNFLTNETDLQHPAPDRFRVFLRSTTNFVQANFVDTLREEVLSKRKALKSAPADSGWLYETGWRCVEEQPLGLLLQNPTSRGFSDFSVYAYIDERIQLPWIELTLNQPTFTTGETLRVMAQLNNPGASPMDLDIKVYLNIPPAKGGGGKSTYLPFIKAHDVQVPAGGSFSGEILSYTFSGAEPPGIYRIQGALHSATGDFLGMGQDLDFWSFSPDGAAPMESLDLGLSPLPPLP